MKSRTLEQLARTLATVFLCGAAAACLVLLASRVYSYIFTCPEPGAMMTTSCEEEALFSIWKFDHHQPVYADPRLIPFAVSYFNWLFFYIYGAVCLVFLKVLHCNVISQATICRLFTLTMALAACGLFFRILWETPKVRQKMAWPLLLAWPVIAILHPLSGFWLMTTRPDVSGFTFELAGLWLILRYMRAPGINVLLWAALAFYAAWSCKQTSVTALGGTLLAFFWLRRWRALLLVAGLWLGLVIMTVILGGEAYRSCAFGLLTHTSCEWSFLALNFTRALIKDPFLPLTLLWIIFLAATNFWKLLSDPVELTCLMMILSALICELPMSSKFGAQEYYFIPLSIWSTLWLALSFDRYWPNGWHAGLVAAAGTMILSIGLIFTGWQGHYQSDNSWARRYQVLAEKLPGLPGPIFVVDRIGNLPWIQPCDPHFVLATTYFQDASTVPHEQGGWEGLMQAGYFSTVVDNVPDSVPSFLCLAEAGKLTTKELARYEVISRDAYFIYYRRKPQP